MQDVLQIIELFTRDLSKGLTINQISKLTKKSYGYCNKHVHELIKHGILNEVKVGNAIYSTLNFRNPQTILLLGLVSSAKKSDEVSLRYINSIKERTCVMCAYSERGTLFLVVKGDKSINTKPSMKVDVIDENEFKANVSNLDVNKINVFYGYENFWNLIGGTK